MPLREAREREATECTMRAFLVVELPPMSTDLANLEFTADEMRRMGYATIERLVDHILSLETQPARGDVAAADLCRRLREPAPEQGVAYEPLLDQLLAEWVPRSFTAPGPGYLAYIPGGGLYPAGLADLIADVVNRYTGVWLAAPALVQLESNALDWLRDWMEFPAHTRGLFTTGGSMAHFNAVLCAREQHLGSEIRPGVLYGSTQMHHSMNQVGPAGRHHAGPDPGGPGRWAVPHGCGGSGRRDCRGSPGRSPTVLCHVVGRHHAYGRGRSVACDRRPVRPRRDLAPRGRCLRGVLLHVSGASGSHARLARADSLTLDPHKGLFLPYGTGALLVRDGAALRRAHEATASYLPGPPESDDFYDPHQYGPELSRGFPGLRVWLCVKLYGAGRFRAALEEKRASPWRRPRAWPQSPGS